MATQPAATFLDGAVIITFEVDASGAVTAVSGTNNSDRSVIISLAKHSTNAVAASRTLAPGASATQSIVKARQFSYATAPDWALDVSFA